MKKTTDELLFEQIMKAPRSVRRKAFEFPFPRPFFVRERLLIVADSCDGLAGYLLDVDYCLRGNFSGRNDEAC